MLSSRLERDKSLKAAANYDDTPGYTRVSGRFNFSISPPPLPVPSPQPPISSSRIAYARCVAACAFPRVSLASARIHVYASAFACLSARARAKTTFGERGWRVTRRGEGQIGMR